MTSDELSDSQTFPNAELESPITLHLPMGKAAVFSRRCPGKSTPNEDSAAILRLGDRAAVLVVADGLGGEAAGERASQAAVEAIQACVVEGVAQGWPVRASILNGFEQANRIVEQLGVGAATTMAVVEIQPRNDSRESEPTTTAGQETADASVNANHKRPADSRVQLEMRPYHVGDSVILLVGGRGKIKMETLSHSPVAYAVAAGMLNEQEAMHHEERHVVSNVIGSPDMRIEIGPAFLLSPRDTVLLASDGLSDNLRTAECAEFIRKGKLHLALSKLALQATERMERHTEGQPSKPDDLTIVAFRPR